MVGCLIFEGVWEADDVTTSDWRDMVGEATSLDPLKLLSSSFAFDVMSKNDL